VKHRQETERVLDRVVRLGRQGRSSALALVTHIQGSSYRRAGAKLLIEEDGGWLGGVSGGCLEDDVRQRGLEVLRSGRSRLVHYDTSDDASRIWGLGLGCDGEVDLVVLPIAPRDAIGSWASARSLLDSDAPVVLATFAEEDTAGGVLALSESGPLVDGLGQAAEELEVEAVARAALRRRRSAIEVVEGRRVFVEFLPPPPKLLVCGAGDDARPLVALASSVGFRVTVADHRAAHLTRELLPEAQRLVVRRPDEPGGEIPSDDDTYAVVKTHSLKQDTEWVRRLLGTDVAYVGILGPRARTRRILADVGARGDERVFGPVGLDLGADGAEQVAVSVVAELLTVRSGRQPIHLRERELPVHAGE
jgi:xanthine/CO dehydrogenase XdhC/CoxF family maturation factor